jgi:hypothetical protein
VSQPFREAADQLLAVAGEQLDEKVTEAARELRDVCAEYDEVSARFDAAALKVMRLLQGKQPQKDSPVAAGALSKAIEAGMTVFDDEADELMGSTDCEHGCTIEADGTCPHGFKSAALTLGVI